MWVSIGSDHCCETNCLCGALKIIPSMFAAEPSECGPLCRDNVFPEKDIIWKVTYAMCANAPPSWMLSFELKINKPESSSPVLPWGCSIYLIHIEFHISFIRPQDSFHFISVILNERMQQHFCFFVFFLNAYFLLWQSNIQLNSNLGCSNKLWGFSEVSEPMQWFQQNQVCF